MDKFVGLSPSCTMCWVDNMACDAATCKEKCLIAKLTRAAPVDKHGHLNASLPFALLLPLFRLNLVLADNGCFMFVTQFAAASPATKTIAETRSFDAPGPIVGAVAFTGWKIPIACQCYAIASLLIFFIFYSTYILVPSATSSGSGSKFGIGAFAEKCYRRSECKMQLKTSYAQPCSRM